MKRCSWKCAFYPVGISDAASYATRFFMIVGFREELRATMRHTRIFALNLPAGKKASATPILSSS
jgi:hypothetical protein